MDDDTEPIPLSLNELRAFLTRLSYPATDTDDGRRVDRLALLECVKAACAGAQIDPTVELDESARAAGSRVESDGTTLRRIDHRKSTASEVALALMTSPTEGSRWVTVASVLASLMPHTRALLASGVLTERRAEILVKETTGLSDDERSEIDRRLCRDPSTLRGCSDRVVAGRAKAIAIELNPKAVADRAKKAESNRRVTVRPAPESMGYLGALLPMKSAVSAWATLRRDADSIIATGGAAGRTRDQIMADLLVSRVLGIETADSIPVTVNVVISDRSLLGIACEAAQVNGFGPIPASIVLDSVTDPDAQVDLRRLYASPKTGELVAMESKSRTFPRGLARWLAIRDEVCRTPWCGAPIRHFDHIAERSKGGPTSAENGAGLCAHCNQVKNQPGWSTVVRPGPGRHTYEIITPTGHRAVSIAPHPPAPEIYSAPEGLLLEWVSVA